jgi:hypothetical protein
MTAVWLGKRPAVARGYGLRVVHYEDLGHVTGMICRGRCAKPIKGNVIIVAYATGQRQALRLPYCKDCVRRVRAWS